MAPFFQSMRKFLINLTKNFHVQILSMNFYHINQINNQLFKVPLTIIPFKKMVRNWYTFRLKTKTKKSRKILANKLPAYITSRTRHQSVSQSCVFGKTSVSVTFLSWNLTTTTYHRQHKIRLKTLKRWSNHNACKFHILSSMITSRK